MKRWLKRFGIEMAILFGWTFLYGFFSVFIYSGGSVFVFFSVTGVAILVFMDKKYGPL